VPLRRDVILAWTGDEERGGEGIRWQLQRHPEVLNDAALRDETRVAAWRSTPQAGQVRCAARRGEDLPGLHRPARGQSGHSSRPVPDNAIYKLAAALRRLGEHRFPPRFLPVTRAFFLATATARSLPSERRCGRLPLPGAASRERP